MMRFFGSQMSHLRAFFCREYRDYALFGVEFLAEICQKFSEILRILAEILRKKLASGASAAHGRIVGAGMGVRSGEASSPSLWSNSPSIHAFQWQRDSCRTRPVLLEQKVIQVFQERES